MENKATIQIGEKRAEAPIGALLSEIIRQDKPCGGHGKCGKCRVMAIGALSTPSEAEKRYLSEQELSKGIRLACQARLLGDAEITPIDKTLGETIELAGALPKHRHAPIFSNYGVALDLGTTTLAARLYDKSGKLLAEAGVPNPEGRLGADVISRIEAAMNGQGKELARLVREGISTLVGMLADAAGIASTLIDAAVITGNTVMLSLLTEEDMRPFSHAPFEASRLFGETVRAKDIGLSCFLESTPIYFPPCFSAFVGADITTACLAAELASKKNALLCDIGTNGEIALSAGGRLTVCSTAAGPAFEGVGISCGMRSARGAVDRVAVKDGGLSIHTVENAPAIGICGSGLIDTTAALLSLELLDESGYLEDAPILLAEGVSITQADIRALQLAKSAITAGMLTLCEDAGLRADDISLLCLAGGFGSGIRIPSAKEIGLLPAKLADRTEVIGNAALAGASLLLLSSETRIETERITQSAKVLTLSGNPTFTRYYTEGMFLCEI